MFTFQPYNVSSLAPPLTPPELKGIVWGRPPFNHAGNPLDVRSLFIQNGLNPDRAHIGSLTYSWNNHPVFALILTEHDTFDPGADFFVSNEPLQAGP